MGYVVPADPLRYLVRYLVPADPCRYQRLDLPRLAHHSLPVVTVGPAGNMNKSQLNKTEEDLHKMKRREAYLRGACPPQTKVIISPAAWPNVLAKQTRRQAQWPVAKTARRARGEVLTQRADACCLAQGRMVQPSSAVWSI